MKGEQTALYIPRNDLSIARSYTVEIPIKNVSAGGQNKFLLNEFLQKEATGSVVYVGMEAWTVTQQAFSESGNAIVSAVEASLLAITLVFNPTEILYLNPYLGFNSTTNFGLIRRLKDLRFSLSDSYITVLGAGVAANKSALITFYFVPPKNR